MNRNPGTASQPLPNARAFSLAEMFLLVTLVAVLLGLMAQPLLGTLVTIHAAAALTVTLWYRDKWLRVGRPLSPLELVGSFAWSLTAAFLTSGVCISAFLCALGWLSLPFGREPLVMLLGVFAAVAVTAWVMGQLSVCVWQEPWRQWILARCVPTLFERVQRFSRCLVLLSCALVCGNVLVVCTDAVYALANQPRETADACVLSLIVRCVMLYGGGWLGYCVAGRNLRESARAAA